MFRRLRQGYVSGVLAVVEPPTESADEDLPSAPLDPSWVQNTRVVFSLGGLVGGAFGSGTQTAMVGFRPEILLVHGQFGAGSWAYGQPRNRGIGLYLEAKALSGPNLMGAGLTLVPQHTGLAIAPSLGVFQQGEQRGIEASLFIGIRQTGWFDPLDLATGVRIDLQKGSGSAPITLGVALQLDLALSWLGIKVLRSDD